jgi:hypothetical protein
MFGALADTFRALSVSSRAELVYIVASHARAVELHSTRAQAVMAMFGAKEK